MQSMSASAAELFKPPDILRRCKWLRDAKRWHQLACTAEQHTCIQYLRITACSVCCAEAGSALQGFKMHVACTPPLRISTLRPQMDELHQNASSDVGTSAGCSQRRLGRLGLGD